MAIAPTVDESIRYAFRSGDTIRLGRVTGFYILNQRFDIILFLIKNKKKLIMPNALEKSKFISCRRVITEKTDNNLNPEWDGWVDSIVRHPPSHINYNLRLPI